MTHKCNKPYFRKSSNKTTQKGYIYIFLQKAFNNFRFEMRFPDEYHGYHYCDNNNQQNTIYQNTINEHNKETRGVCGEATVDEFLVNPFPINNDTETVLNSNFEEQSGDDDDVDDVVVDDELLADFPLHELDGIENSRVSFH